MKINSIQVKSGNKYLLIIDDKKYILYDDVIIKYQLYNKKEIDESLLKKINDDQNFYTAYYKMISFLSYKMRTEQEVRNKLRSYHLGKSLTDLVVDKLKEDNYLNKDKYLNSFFHDQIALTLNGPDKIKFDLKKIGYNEDEIDNLIYSINEDEWLNRINKIIDKKLKANHTLSCRMFNLKIRQHLNGLGYSNDLVDKIGDIVFDDKQIYQKTYDKLYKQYKNKCKDSDLENKINNKLYQLGFKL